METTLNLTQQELNIIAAAFGELSFPIKHTAEIVLPLLKKLEDAAKVFKDIEKEV